MGRKEAPTEAEWEKAAGWDVKAKQQRRFPWGDEFDPSLVNSMERLGYKADGGLQPHQWREAWAESKEGQKLIGLGGNTSPVGKTKNDVSPWGCFDMGCNAGEWCADWWDKNYYKTGPSKNPKGPDQGEERVARGGSWANYYRYCETYRRRGRWPTTPCFYQGFRCAADCP